MEPKLPASQVLKLCIIAYNSNNNAQYTFTMYIQDFKGYSFCGLCGQQITHEVFISLVKLRLAQGLH